MMPTDLGAGEMGADCARRRPYFSVFLRTTMSVAFVLAGVLLGMGSSAAEPVCKRVSFDKGAKPLVTDIYIYLEEGRQTQLTGVGLQTFRDVVVAAAERWNAQSNGGYLRFAGYTHGPRLNALTPQFECPPDRHIALVVPDRGQGASNGGLATASPACGGRGFVVRIPNLGSDGALREWITEPEGERSGDLMATLMHEFGHGLAVNHPWGATRGDRPRVCPSRPIPEGARCGECRCQDGLTCAGGVCTSRQAVMGGPTRGLRRRNLYEYDGFCAQRITTERHAKAEIRVLKNGGFDPPRVISGSLDVAQGGITVYQKDGKWQFGAVLSRAGPAVNKARIDWLSNLNLSGSNGVYVEQPRSAYGFTPMIWWERDTETVRVAYVDGRDVRLAGDGTGTPFQPDDPYDQDTVHGVSLSLSERDYAGAERHRELLTCDDMASTSTLERPVCDGTRRVYSAHRVAYAYARSVGRTVLVWQQMLRGRAPITPQANALNSVVSIAIGAVDDHTMARPTLHPAQSHVGPGVACLAGKAFGGRDCVVAYVDGRGHDFRIRTLAFTIHPQGLRYTATRIHGESNNAGVPVITRERARGELLTLEHTTGADIALWAHNGRFYMAYKSMEREQPTVLLSSSDGVSDWQREANLPYSITGPSIVGHAVNTNVLMTLSPK